MEADITCPSCGEPLTLWIDEGGGRRMTYVEDCEVCCRPMEVTAVRNADGDIDVTVRGLDE